MYAQIMGKKQHTPVKKKMTSCVFDHVMFFNFKNLQTEEIEEAVIKVSRDANTTFGRRHHANPHTTVPYPHRCLSLTRTRSRRTI